MAKIAFTFEIDTKVGQTRLYAGDTDGEGLNRTGGDRTRADSEIEFLLSQNAGDPRVAGAALLETKAAEYAQSAVQLEQGALRQNYLTRSSRCLEAAKALRDHSSGRIQTGRRTPTFTVEQDGEPGSMERW